MTESAFVEAVRQTLQAAEPVGRRRRPVAALIAAGCAATGCHPRALQEGSRRAPAARPRKGVAYLALEVCGYTAAAVADQLGVHPSAVYRAAQRGRAVRARWERLLAGSLSERNIRKQRPYDGFEFSKMQFVGGLKIQPGLRIGAEVVLET